MSARRRVPRAPLVRLAWLAVAALSVACGKSPQARAADALDAATSWSAAAKMVAEQWERGAVPRRYTTEALRTSGEQLQRTGRSIERMAQVPDTLGAAALRDIMDASAAAERARRAVERSDATGIAPEIDTLGRVAQRLRQRSQAVTAANR